MSEFLQEMPCCAVALINVAQTLKFSIHSHSPLEPLGPELSNVSVLLHHLLDSPLGPWHVIPMPE